MLPSHWLASYKRQKPRRLQWMLVLLVDISNILVVFKMFLPDETARLDVCAGHFKLQVDICTLI